MPSKVVKKSLGELLKQAKATAAAKPRAVSRTPQPPLSFTTVALTPSAKTTLDHLTKQVEGHTGRRVSASSVVRALLHVVEQRDLAKHVTTAIETEINTGAVVWGRGRKGR
jgi:hypothetical protein